MAHPSLDTCDTMSMGSPMTASSAPTCRRVWADHVWANASCPLTQARLYQLGEVLYELMKVAAGESIAGECTGMMLAGNPDAAARCATLLPLQKLPIPLA